MRSLPLLVLPLLLACRADGEPSSPSTPTPTPAPVPTTTSPATLAELSVGDATLRPPFRPDLRYYWVRASDFDFAEVSAVPTYGQDQVEVRVETPDGTPLGSGSLVSGVADQRIRIDVTSPDGATTTSYSVALLGDDFPVPTVEGEAGAGWTFINASPKDDSPYANALAVVDGNGTPGWWRPLARPAHDLRLSPDGAIMWIGRTEELPSTRQNLVLGDDGFDLALPAGDVPSHWQLTEVDEHEFEVTREGTVIRMLNYRVQEDLSPWGGPADQRVLHMVAQEVDFDGNVLFEVSTEGLIPYDELPPNLASTMDDLDWEPIHFNSISVDPADGHWVISMQRVSVIAKFARTGPQAGQMLWQLGGEGSDFVFVDDERLGGWEGIGGQHSARVTGPDRIEVFDNANGDAEMRGDVRIVEYQLDLDAMTATKVDERVWEGRGRAFAGGSVQSLPNGHHVVGFGSLVTDAQGERVPTVTELDAEGDELWNLFLPDGNWSYRAWRFEGDPLDGGWVVP